MSRNMRSLAVAVVLAIFAAGSVSALPLDAARAEGGTDLLSQIWEWLASLTEPEGAQTDPDRGLLEKEGSQMDPNGHH
jgi:hypothetical protein